MARIQAKVHRDPSPSPRGALWPFVVVLAVIVLLPVGRASEVPIAIGVITAIVLALRGRSVWRHDPAIHLVVILFACYWLPALLSAFAAVEPGKAWMTVATTLRFLPFALFAAFALRDEARWPALIAAVALVVGLWALDAWV
ncbi:MAG TPA: hypothetical protein VLK83_13495, partial [Rhodanobacteraceae bacterium]|nr:hypothetical protein [Rhodanobacteraceae bacterium]